LRLALAIALAVSLTAALGASTKARAQETPPAAVPAELSEEARRAYNQGLREVRDLIARKQLAAAATRIDTLIQTRPREPQARFLKGVVETERGETDAAVATFRALTEDFPELPEPHNNLAVIYAQKGDYTGARTELEAALAAAPNWPVAHENLGDIHAHIAAIHYDRAAALDRDNTTAPAKLALVRELLAPRAASTGTADKP